MEFTSDSAVEALKARIAERDFLMRWFVERLIDKPQLFAARLWQHDGEKVVLQLGGYDMDAPVSQQFNVWQVSGDLTDPQFRALRRRKVVAETLGLPVVGFLDNWLGVFDFGRSDVRIISPLKANHWHGPLKYYLRQLAVCYGQRCSTPSQTKAQLAQNRISALKDLESPNAA